ncbi:HTH domain-containing protein [Halovenus halobia]|uniref:HTH domain-containing protein n=1 Tax=Halovenus halobia TaxID=3396622 RepID=UPI003F5586D1
MSHKLDGAIRSVVDTQGPVTATEIATTLDAHPVTVRRHCQRLQQAGRIETESGGGYINASQGGPTAAD